MIVLDTHILLWWLAGSKELPAAARRKIDAVASNGFVAASAITVFEIGTAVRRDRIRLAQPFEAWLDDVQRLPEIRIVPVDVSIAAVACRFDASVHGDPADRIILATAHCLNYPLATADTKLRSSGLARLAW
jgi:PIN domain nuclease of toxin-antitoxin system